MCVAGSVLGCGGKYGGDYDGCQHPRFYKELCSRNNENTLAMTREYCYRILSVRAAELDADLEAECRSMCGAGTEYGQAHGHRLVAVR